MIKKIIKIIFQHKIIASLVLVSSVGGSFFAYAKLTPTKQTTKYLVSSISKGNIITSVTGTGQVLSTNQVDIKPKVSGNIIKVSAKVGDNLKESATIVEIDNQEAQKTVRDAQDNLASANLSLEKLLAPPDKASLTQAENAVSQAKRNLDKLINPSDTLNLTQAENALSQAKRDLETLKSSPDEYSLTQAANSLSQAKDSLTKLQSSQSITLKQTNESWQKSTDNLAKGYEDSFNVVSDTFLDLSNIITGLNTILYSEEIAKSDKSIGSYSWNVAVLINAIKDSDRDKINTYSSDAKSNYQKARDAYDKNFDAYKQTSRYSNTSDIEALLNQTYATSKIIAETVKNESNMLDYWVDYRNQHSYPVYSKVTEYQALLKTYTSQTDSHLSALLSSQRSIQDNKEAKLNAERNLSELSQNQPIDLANAQKTVIERQQYYDKVKNGATTQDIKTAEEKVKEKQASYDKLKAGSDKAEIASAKEALAEKELALSKLRAGADQYEIKNQKLSIDQKNNALIDAKQKLNDYTIKMPFDGVLASLSVKKGDSVSSSTSIGTVMTKQKIAQITLNESDITKIKNGQKGTITFDAIDSLEITGEVVEVDNLATTSQGVVSYNVKIMFDTQDERVKPGMSISASIITDFRQDVLSASNSSIKKSSDGSSYVQIVTKQIDLANQPKEGVEIDSKEITRQTIEVGLANDSSTEILSGLKEGDAIISQTITASTTKTNTSATSSNKNSSISIPGMNMGVGGPPGR